MDPECEAIVLFISTTKWSIKVTSIDRRTPPNTSLTVYIIQLITIYSLPFILGNWDLRFESFGVYASSHLESTLRVIWSLRFETRYTMRGHGRIGDFYKEQDSVS